VILFPAVDLKNGQCVRLEQGDMARATVFNLDPAAQARSFAEQGFEYLHVVDLDGAFAGKPMNAHAVEAMLKAVTIPIGTTMSTRRPTSGPKKSGGMMPTIVNGVRSRVSRRPIVSAAPPNFRCQNA